MHTFSKTIKGLQGIVVALLLRRSNGAGHELEDCTSIPELFANALVEENSNSALMGDFNSTGSWDLWSNNSLHEGSIDGPQIGSGSGKCSLLPGAENWMCVGVLKLSEEDTITYAGLSPNSLTGGTMAITGGTGCYEGAGGAFTLTAQNVVGEFDAYLLEYVPELEDRSACLDLDELFGDDGLGEANFGTETIGNYETPGSMDLWTKNPIVDSNNTQIGFSDGVCTLLPGIEMWMCVGQLTFDSGDILTFGGNSPNSQASGTIAITGGTGCYSGAGGTIVQTPLTAALDAYLWEYDDPNDPAECPKLVTALGGSSKVFDENSGSIIIGGSESVGSQEIYFGNNLRSGNSDGDIVGSNVGYCTLLPGMEEFFCVGQFILEQQEGGSTIVYTGSRRNSFETGIVSIDGGTDCFTATAGTMELTAQSIAFDYDYYRFEIVSTNDEDKVDPTEPPTPPPTEGPTDIGFHQNTLSTLFASVLSAAAIILTVY